MGAMSKVLSFSWSIADFLEDRRATQALDHPFKVSAQAFVPFLTFSRSLVMCPARLYDALTGRCVDASGWNSLKLLVRSAVMLLTVLL